MVALFLELLVSVVMVAPVVVVVYPAEIQQPEALEIRLLLAHHKAIAGVTVMLQLRHLVLLAAAVLLRPVLMEGQHLLGRVEQVPHHLFLVRL